MNSTPQSVADLIVFAILAGVVVAGALSTVTRRNPVAAVMSLVLTFFALAGLYATLSAHFLAVLQVAVYAGAIMVLFVFVVMILNRDEVEPVSFRGIITRGAGVLAVAYFILVLARVVWASRGTTTVLPVLAQVPDNFGTVAAVGNSLFREFVFPFEAISLLLLVAIVGGVTVSRSQKQEEEAEETAQREAVIRAAIREETRVGGALPAAGHDDHGHAAAHH